MPKADTYERLVQDVERCFACPLSKSRLNVVIDRGNPEADLAFVGEAPGRNEDEIGEAFVGVAGEELDELIYEADLDENNLIILNILKCRPPKNEFPTQSVVKQCLPLLDRQIGLINPKVVVLTGRQAARWTIWRSYMQAPNMGDLAGQWIWSQRYPLIDFLAMYHTSWLLRMKRMKPREYEDERERSLDVLEWARDLLDGKEPPVEPLVVGARVRIERARARVR